MNKCKLVDSLTVGGALTFIGAHFFQFLHPLALLTISVVLIIASIALTKKEVMS